MKTVVIIPTYNELGSLESLISSVFSLAIADLSVIVVDDNSPDGTGVLAEELALKYPITVIHRPEKRGLGTAYVEAFRSILDSKIPPDYVIQMDADLSHNPKDIPRFLEKIKECDVVLGSRYVRGGGTENWSIARELISRFGCFFSRVVLGLPYRDLTGGFKCYRREVLEKMNLDSLSSVGYNFQIETTYRAHTQGARICEIPIIFVERKSGVSKFNISIIIESFIKVLELRFRE
jgi:dolichol-phosphate mannosyltransferase